MPYLIHINTDQVYTDILLKPTPFFHFLPYRGLLKLTWFGHHICRRPELEVRLIHQGEALWALEPDRIIRDLRTQPELVGGGD